MTDRFPPIDAQLWLARKLGRPDLFAGLTDNIERRERIRNEIIERGLTRAVLGQFNGVREEFFMTFERMFGVPFFTIEDNVSCEAEEMQSLPESIRAAQQPTASVQSVLCAVACASGAGEGASSVGEGGA